MERCLSPHDGRVQKLKRIIFSISPVRLDEDKGDYWILDDLAVTLGAGCSPGARDHPARICHPRVEEGHLTALADLKRRISFDFKAYQSSR